MLRKNCLIGGNISPSNFVSSMVESNMLQVIVMAVLLGFAIIMRGEKKRGKTGWKRNCKIKEREIEESRLRVNSISLFLFLQ